MKSHYERLKRLLLGTLRLTALAFVLLGGSSSCEQHTVAHIQRSLPLDGWEQSDTIRFVIDSIPATGDYQLGIDLRTTDDYPYQSIYLKIEQTWEAPRMSRCDTLRCQLATADGEVAGAGISHFQYTFPLAVQHLEAGQYGQLVVRHIMQCDLLHGMASIGIKLEKLNGTF